MNACNAAGGKLFCILNQVYSSQGTITILYLISKCVHAIGRNRVT